MQSADPESSWYALADEALSDTRDSRNNQDFLRIIQQLKQALSPTGVSKQKEAVYNRVSSEYAQQKRKYLKSKLLYDALYDSVRDRMRTSMDADALDIFLQQVESEMTEREFDEAVMNEKSLTSHSEESEKLRKTLPNDVELRISALHGTVSRFYAALNGNVRHGDTQAKLASDFAMLKEHNEAVKSNGTELIQVRSEVKTLRTRRQALQRRYVDSLHGVVREHCVSQNSHVGLLQNAQMEASVARCEALAAKIGLIQQRIIAATYDDRAFAALKQIRLELDAEKLKLESEKRRMEDALKSYAENKLLFAALAEEQRRLKQQICDLEPAIQKLT